MIDRLLNFIPGVGPFLAAGFRVANSTVGRLVIVAAVSFGAGWKAKDRIDDARTARAVIAKQEIDLRAAKESAEQTSATLAELAKTDQANQEVIRDLQERLAKQPQAGACTLDDDAAGSLRKLE